MKTNEQIRKPRSHYLILSELCYNKSCLADLTIILLLAFLIVGCMPCYYTPNVQNVPMFNARNQANATVGYRFGLYSRGWDIQSAYSLTDHIGIMANYNHFGATYNESEDGWVAVEDGNFRGNLFEFGLGYYRPIPGDFIFEAYGGAGWGNITNEFSDYLSHLESEVKYNRYFIQPAIGWRHSNINLAFSTRFCAINYTHYTLQDPQNQYDMFELMGVDHNPCWMLEPAFTFRGGGKVVKFQTQIGLSFELNNEEVNYDPFSFSFGVAFTIRGKTEKKEDQSKTLP